MKIKLLNWILPTLSLLGCSTMNVANVQLLDSNHTPGYSIRRIQNDKVTYNQFGGVRSTEFPNLIEENDLWHIGSCTKSMTSYLIAKLVDEGRLDFNSTLDKFLEVQSKSKISQIKIIELLTHRSGLPELTSLADQ